MTSACSMNQPVNVSREGPAIAPAFLAEQLQRGGRGRLLDVRTGAEFRAAHVEGFRCIPLHELNEAAVEDAFDDSEAPLFVMCQSGGRAAKACEKLRGAGVGDVVLIEGGMNAWQEAGLPVKRGKGAMSIERQVRIVAGLLVLLGVGLGLGVHPGFFGLSAFVGAGLAFAGLTDFCGMGLLLARMPWNRVGGGPSSRASK